MNLMAVGALLGAATAGNALGRCAGPGVDVGHVPWAGGRAHAALMHVLVDNTSAGFLIRSEWRERDNTWRIADRRTACRRLP